ncbi:MAG TPA: RHS repeat-associated core domain-containing protein [Thermoanaerobaculia bacterium]|jgi:hypothetical protein|nr:RHS repeat-associated core domain-containing protein [Thermoanaerobaculia bacterium]
MRQGYGDVSTTNASGLARFLSVDPVMDVKRALPQPQRWNRYTYVLNNPLQYVDPDGRDVHVAPGMQSAVNHGRKHSVAFATMYNRLAGDSRVYWLIRPANSAKPGTRADSTQQPPQVDAQGRVTRVVSFSDIPTFNALDVKTKLVAHEGAHITEILDTNKTLAQRVKAGEAGVYPNSAAGPNAFESTNAKQFEQLVGTELASGDTVLEITRDVTDLLNNSPGVR